jgi:hypothetical protein
VEVIVKTRLAAVMTVATTWAISMPLGADDRPARTYAQRLVDDAVARHPEVLVVMMHVTPPKTADNVVIASNIGRIGKKADEDDLRVIQTGKPNLEVNKAGDRFEVELPLQDLSHRTVGALGVVFRYKAGDDKLALQRKAEAIRDEMRSRISHTANLMDPERFDTETPSGTYAQALVDRTLAAHPEVLILGMHVTPPHRSDNVIIASNIGRIGKRADEDDLGVIRTSKPKLELNETGDRFEVELPLHDAAAKPIGALGVVFPYKKGDSEAVFQKKAEAVRDEMAREIPSLAKLMEPAR